MSLSMFLDRIIYFDICAVIILIIIFLSMMIRKMTKGTSNIFFLIVLVVCIFTAFIDLWCTLYSSVLPMTQKNLCLRYIIHCLYFIFRNFSMFAFVAYIISVSGSWFLFKENKIQIVILVTPYIILLFLVLSNIFTKAIFYFDEQMLYQRGPAILLLYVIAGFYMVYGVCFLIRYRKLFSRNQFIALISMIPINLLAVIIQLFMPSLLIEMFATSVAMLIISISIQSPENIIDTETSVFNQKTYFNEIKRNFFLKKNMNIIFVGIQNFKDLQVILNYNSLSFMLNQIGKELEFIKKDCKYFCDIFYLKNGLFALISYDTNSNITKEIASEIHAFMMKSINIKQLEIKMIPRICYFQTPRDIDSYESLISFGKSYQALLPNSKTAIDISEINLKKELYLRNDLNDIVADAIINRRFQMYYQPIYSVKEKKYVSAEALIRLKHEKYGFISPELFITAAEKNGTILQIGDFIFDEVCRFIGSEDFKQLNLKFIEINLSVAQCLEADLAEKVKSYLNKYNISPSKLNLEITERETIQDQSVFDNNMKQLVDMGIDFSLDDYGTGYSNIRRIAHLPLKVVKIDKSFVDEISSPIMQSIIANTIHMLQEINKEIVVEGVEDAETAKRFIDLNCDYLQGFYFSKPLSMLDFIELVKNQNELNNINSKLYF